MNIFQVPEISTDVNYYKLIGEDWKFLQHMTEGLRVKVLNSDQGSASQVVQLFFSYPPLPCL